MPELLLQPPDLAARTRARSFSSRTSTSSTRSMSSSQVVERHASSLRDVTHGSSASARTSSTRVDQRRGDSPASAIDATPARCRRPPRRRSGRPRRRAPGREMPKPSAIGSVVSRADAAAPAPRRPSPRVSRAPVTPSREMPYRKPLPSAAAFRIRASVVVGLSRKIVSSPRAEQRRGTRRPPRSAGRAPARRPRRRRGAAAANASRPIRSSGLA